MSLILVTGASAGLGFLTATSLVDAGHNVVLHARNPHRITQPNVLSRVHGTVYGDLSDDDQTRRVAEEANQFGRFDAVIHNAGVIEGPELVGVNVVAPYLLTALMGRPKRIIVLSSSMHRSGSPHRLRTEVFSGHNAITYSDSKLYVTALALCIARRWPDVLAHAVDPGWVPTRMGGPSATDDSTEGHRTQEWLATADATSVRPHTGGYWHHGKTQRPHPAANDPAIQHELLTVLEATTGVFLAP